MTNCDDVSLGEQMYLQGIKLARYRCHKEWSLRSNDLHRCIDFEHNTDYNLIFLSALRPQSSATDLCRHRRVQSVRSHLDRYT